MQILDKDIFKEYSNNILVVSIKENEGVEEIYSKIGFLDIGFVSLYLKSLLIGALSSLIYGEVKYGLTDEEVKLINLIKKNPKIKRIEFVDYGFCDKSVYNYCVKICKKIGIIDSKNKGTGLKMLKNLYKNYIIFLKGWKNSGSL